MIFFSFYWAVEKCKEKISGREVAVNVSVRSSEVNAEGGGKELQTYQMCSFICFVSLEQLALLYTTRNSLICFCTAVMKLHLTPPERFTLTNWGKTDDATGFFFNTGDPQELSIFLMSLKQRRGRDMGKGFQRKLPACLWSGIYGWTYAWKNWGNETTM